MANYLDAVQKALHMNRRDFLKASAATATALAVGELVSCAPSSQSNKKDDDNSGAPNERNLIDGTWKSAACWHNCGGGCINKALVQDGIVIRQKTDDTHEDSYDFPQQRSCLRGHSQRKHVLSADRLKYPMKRKNWNPDNPNGDLRGKDEWERISWDEAFKYIADQLTRAYSNYGPRSILAHSGGYTGCTTMRALYAMGGCCGITDTTSYGTYCLDTSKLGIPAWDADTGSANDRYDLVNADCIILQGGNPAWASGGSTRCNFLYAKDAGVEFVMVGPSYNATAQLLNARWIPVRAGTDMAFMLAVAYEMLMLDESEGDIVDWDFLKLYTVGFDIDHMPPDAKINENFKII